MNGRVIAFDLGEKRIGVAVSDEMAVLATGRDTIPRHGESYPWRRLLEAVAEAQAVRIVVGDPVHMNGEAGEQSRLAREFAREIGERTGLPVELEDERLTSEEAEEILGRRARRARARGDVDRVAATLILQGWLDGRSGKETRT